MPQTLVIGDIHGCYEELQALLDRAGLSSDDAIISLGDLVDRGPASPAVWRFFAAAPQAHAIMGNHERKHVRYRRGELKLALSQKITRRQFAEEEADYDTAVTFMAGLPLYLELPEALLVHGYVEPGVPLSRQRPTVLCGTMGGDKHLTTTYDRPWYELYDFPKPVLVGHANYGGGPDPFIYQDRVFGLDTDCCRGGRLTGLLLPSFRLLSVPARRHYWREVRRRYRPPRQKTDPDPATLPWEKQAHWLAQQRQQANLSPEQSAPVAAVAALRRQAKALLPALFTHLVQQHETVLAALRQAHPDYDQLPRKEQGRRYQAALGKRPAHAYALLHQLRTGQLTEETMTHVLRTPQQVIALATALLPAEADS